MAFKRYTPTPQNPVIECAELRMALNDVDPEIRRFAAGALVSCENAAAYLSSRLEIEIQASVREALLLSLSRLNERAALTSLLGCLRSADVSLRNDACATLKRMDCSIAQEVYALMQEDSSDIRLYAVDILGALPHPSVAQWLIGIIEEDPDINVAAAAAERIDGHYSEGAPSALKKLADRFPQDNYVEFVVKNTLSRLKGY